MSSDYGWARFRGEGSERERFLAIAGVVLATGCIAGAYLTPALLGPHLNFTRALFFAYLTFSVINFVATRGREGSSWRWCVHALGVVLVCLLILSTGGAHSPFLILYLLLLLAVAEAWGIRGTLLTAYTCACLLFGLPLVLSSRLEPALQLSGAGVSIKALLPLSVSLILASCLLGYLAEEDKRRQANARIISRLIGNAMPEIGLSASIEGLLHSVREYFDADQVRLALRSVAGDEAYLWEAGRPKADDENSVRFSKLSDAERRAYFATLPEEVWRSVQERRPANLEDIKPETSTERGGAQRGVSTVLGRLGTLHDFGKDPFDMRVVGERHTLFVGFSSLLAVSFSYQRKWFGRFLVYNNARGAFQKGDARFLGDLIREVAPGISYMHHLSRLRSRAQAAERTRLAHEIHDGIIQSLLVFEIQAEVVRRQASGDPSRLMKEISRLQELLRQAILDLRERMQFLKTIEVEPSQLVSRLGETVERFGRDQPISVSFVCDAEDISLPGRVCSELVRILQEALVNIRKHSGAQKVLVRFGREDGVWKLLVEDDGRGFGFAGRLSLAELEAASLGPRVIRERLRSIGAELVIESVPGRGARLEISLLPVGYERAA